MNMQEATILKVFCSGCTNAAEGELSIEIKGEPPVKLPVCATCAAKPEKLFLL